MKKRNVKILLLTFAAVVLLFGAVGGTVAWISENTDSVQNTFSPASVDVQVTESFNGSTKSDVKVSNVGNTSAYIRAAIVAYWVYEDGSVAAPWEGTVSINSGWTKQGDYYYYNQEVPENGETTALFAAYTAPAAPVAGAKLKMDILAQGIQSTPQSAVSAAWGFVPGN